MRNAEWLIQGCTDYPSAMRASYLSSGKHPLVLCYHAVSDTLPSDLAVAHEQLRSHVSVLAELGYESVTFSQLERMRRAGDDTAGKVAITFDDGYASTLAARDILAERGYRGTVFVLPPMIGQTAPMRWHGVEQWADGVHASELLPLDWDGVAALQTSGWEIGSHTMTHPNLRRVDDAQLANELVDSHRLLTKQLGSCESIAYPYGHATKRVARAARDAGYLAGTTLTRWHFFDTSYRRPRVGIFLGDDPQDFERKIAGWTRTARSMPQLLTGRFSD